MANTNTSRENQQGERKKSEVMGLVTIRCVVAESDDLPASVHTKVCVVVAERL